MNAEGLALLRLLILKMWSLNEVRQHQNCDAIAVEINTWMPAAMKITAGHVHAALGGGATDSVTVNLALLRTKIDKTPHLYSARMSGDYQAILNEVIREPDLHAATLADVVEAMAMMPVAKPKLIVAGSASLVGRSAIG